jgi:hypothetical protein
LFTYGLANRKNALLDPGETSTWYCKFVKSVVGALVTVTHGPRVGAGLCCSTKLAEGMVQETIALWPAPRMLKTGDAVERAA